MKLSKKNKIDLGSIVLGLTGIGLVLTALASRTLYFVWIGIAFFLCVWVLQMFVRNRK